MRPPVGSQTDRGVVSRKWHVGSPHGGNVTGFVEHRIQCAATDSRLYRREPVAVWLFRDTASIQRSRRPERLWCRMAHVEMAGTTGKELAAALIEAAVLLERLAERRAEEDDGDWTHQSVETALQKVKHGLEAGHMWVAYDPEKAAVFERAFTSVGAVITLIREAVAEDRRARRIALAYTHGSPRTAPS